MKTNIKDIEKNLPPKRKSLLYSLRDNNWRVIEVNDECYHECDWSFDQRWIIESKRENYGFLIHLWFLKYVGIYDGLDNVLATKIDVDNTINMINPYSHDFPVLYFDGNRYEYQLNKFINRIHKLRIK